MQLAAQPIVLWIPASPTQARGWYTVIYGCIEADCNDTFFLNCHCLNFLRIANSGKSKTLENLVDVTNVCIKTSKKSRCRPIPWTFFTFENSFNTIIDDHWNNYLTPTKKTVQIQLLEKETLSTRIPKDYLVTFIRLPDWITQNNYEKENHIILDPWSDSRESLVVHSEKLGARPEVKTCSTCFPTNCAASYAAICAD